MKNFSILIIVLALTACGSILPKGAPAPTLYTLNAQYHDSGNAVKHIPVSLRILMPQGAPGLETDKIALRKADQQLDYYADARWSGTLPAVLQSKLVQIFDNAKQLDSVSNDLVAVNQDYSLLVEIQDFQIEYPRNVPVAHIGLTTKLIEAQSNKIITTVIYSDKQPSTANTIQDVVKALDTAYQRVSSKIVKDTLRTLTQEHSKQIK